MVRALALSLNVSNAPTRAVHSKANLVAGTVFIFMCRKLKEAKAVPRKRPV
jgi:hypothetical protein